MPNYVCIIIKFIIAYLIGSIPSSVWIGKIFYGIDIREHGSGNPGTSNTFRVLGVKAGIPVLLFDTFKGYFATILVTIVPLVEPGINQYINLQILYGMFALLGHIFPLYAGFKGGKGVATLLGIGIGLQPFATLVSIGVYIIILLTTRYASLSSMIAGIAFPLSIILIFHVTAISLIVFSIVVSVVILITHQKNILRLINHQETKANLFRGKKT